MDYWAGRETQKERQTEKRLGKKDNTQILPDAHKNAKLMQEELAKRIGADKGYTSRIERGLTVPIVSILCRIAVAMELTVESRPI